MTQRNLFNLEITDPSWHECLTQALNKMDPAYLEELYANDKWLPGHSKIFNAFTLPIDQVNYVLFGESPYPRAHSANGYAFWDAAVTDLWSLTGLSKQVNRATSLRNIIKMLLIAEGLLAPHHTKQDNIANVNKNDLVPTNYEFFKNFLSHGFLLLNASLVLHSKKIHHDAIEWHPFIHHVLDFLIQKRPQVEFLLFGRIAKLLDDILVNYSVKKLIAEHPYNLTFIDNNEVIDFFKPLHLLKKNNSHSP